MHQPTWGHDDEGNALTLLERSVWTCPVHERPVDLGPESHEDEGPEWGFRSYGCTCGHGARWEKNGEMYLGPKRSALAAMSEILRNFYLGPMVEHFNRDPFMPGLIDRG